MIAPPLRLAISLGALLALSLPLVACGLKGPLQPLPEGSPGLGESLLPWETSADAPASAQDKQTATPTPPADARSER